LSTKISKLIRRLLFLALWLLVVYATLKRGYGQVCVRPVFPFGNEEPTKLVLQELAKKHIDAQVCSDKEQAIELYFYPLSLSFDSDETLFSISASPTSTGVIGTISTTTMHFNNQVWVVSVHPWGTQDSVRRQTGYSLKSQVRAIAKWINKRP